MYSSITVLFRIQVVIDEIISHIPDDSQDQMSPSFRNDGLQLVPLMARYRIPPHRISVP